MSSSRSLIYSSTTTEDSLSILNNRLHNGYYGIYLYGGDYEKRHIITGNTFTGNYQYCVYLRKFDGLNFSNNTLNAASTGNVDIYMYTGSGACTFQRNRIFSDNSNYAWYLGTITTTTSRIRLCLSSYL
ncbi:MAG: right-handed parallel beta-helix repeat-containing protein [Saprospiraceae bacterium]|nr:right-handed parallel beta-helix repeat-containing protein [Candidatus Opimibacter iunctus]